jgi:choline-phosphate cytidylyltransferase
MELNNNTRSTRVYVDGIFDLFHRGHLESLKTCKLLFSNVYLIVGIIDDKTATFYKRVPIYSEDDRYTIIENIKCVDEIVKNAPLIINEDFLEKYKIDYVVHGFSNPGDSEKQSEFFDIPKKLNKFVEIPYYDKISTTEIIEKINSLKK